MGSFKVSKLISSVCLTATLCFTTFASMIPLEAHADAKERMQTNIQWAQSKGFEELDAESLGELTYEDLQMVGVFLSNFFVPFSTELGRTTRSGGEEETKKAMKEALVDQCNFDGDVAEYLVSAVWTMTLDTAEPLSIGEFVPPNLEKGEPASVRPLSHTLTYSNLWGDKTDNIDNTLTSAFLKLLGLPEASKFTPYSWKLRTSKDEGDDYLAGSYYNFLLTFSGGVSPDTSISNSYGAWALDASGKLDMGYKGKSGGNDQYDNIGYNPEVCLFWTDSSGTKHPVLDSSTKLRDIKFTASTLSYALINDSMNYSGGIGGSLLSVENYEAYKNLDETSKEIVSVAGSQLYVDCFGNILMDFGGSQLVVLPACANPYIWYDTTVDGVDADLPSTAGTGVNLVNAFMLGEIENGRITYDGNGETATTEASTEESDTESNSTPSSKKVKPQDAIENINMYFYTGEGSLFSTKFFTTYYGSDSVKLDLSIKDDEETETLKYHVAGNDMVYAPTNINDNNSLPFPNWSKFFGGVRYKNPDESALSDLTSWDELEMLSKVQYGGFKDEKGANVSVGCFSTGGSSGHTQVNLYTSNGNGGAASAVRNDTRIFMDMVMIDDTGAYETSDDPISVLKATTIFNPDTGQSIGTSGLAGTASFSSVRQKGTTTQLTGTRLKPYLMSVYLSYVFAYYDESEGADRKVQYAFNKNGIPSPDIGTLDWSDIEIETNALQNEVMSLAYYFMHPTEGIDMIKLWCRNKISAVLIAWHEDMVGRADASSTTGSTKYVGFSGYVTIPALDDLEWTAWLVETYDTFVIYFIIAIVIILLGYKMLGNMTLQQALLSAVMFAVCAYLPPRAIDVTVNASNQICNSIYSSKFTYWALLQHEQYASEIQNAVSGGSEWNYLSTIFGQQAQESADNYAVVTVRWQCPKKENYWAKVKEEVSEATDNAKLYSIIGGLVRDVTSGESYVAEANNQYLYRSYTDLGTYADTIYKDGSFVTPSNSNTTITFVANEFSKYKDVPDSNYDAISNYWFNHRLGYMASDSSLRVHGSSEVMTRCVKAIDLGFIYDTVFINNVTSKGSVVDSCYYNRRFLDIVSSDAVMTAITRGAKISDEELTIEEDGDSLLNGYVGIPLSVFNLTLAELNSDSIDYTKSDSLTKLETMLFAQYTESPFYYLSFNLNDQLGAEEARSGGTVATYKDLFLQDDGMYFYNMKDNDGYGELRDFMDMRSLFYQVIPYLKLANDVVVDYDNKNGLYMYDDIELEYDENNNIVPFSEVAGGSDIADLEYKYTHNLEVAQLLNMYTPWVDVMYECDYADGEVIYVAGEKYYVENPLDPLSYYDFKNGEITAGREMVFSRSEMKYFGLSMEDLTQVEQQIIKLNDNVYSELLQIIDYYNFQPEVLNTAIAMIETFEFNKAFSESNLLDDSNVLYPQNFELKNFSYDAYLRLILAGSTGIDMNNLEHGDIYTEVVKNSSIVSAVLFLMLDILACYAIPALKLFFVLAIFFLSIVMIMIATIRLEVKLSKVLGESLIFPLLKFFGVTILMAFLVSLFMYGGNTAVTGRKVMVISLGSPVMVMIVMLVINIATLFGYFKICKGVIKDCKKYAEAVATSVSGVVAGTIAKAGETAVTGGRSKGTSRFAQRRAEKRYARAVGKAVRQNSSPMSGSYGGGMPMMGSGSAGGSADTGDTPSMDTNTATNLAQQQIKPNPVRTKREADSTGHYHNKFDTLSENMAKRKANAEASHMDAVKRREEVNDRRSQLSNVLRENANNRDFNMAQRTAFKAKAAINDRTIAISKKAGSMADKVHDSAIRQGISNTGHIMADGMIGVASGARSASIARAEQRKERNVRRTSANNKVQTAKNAVSTAKKTTKSRARG